jgi:hypothetical protein
LQQTCPALLQLLQLLPQAKSLSCLQPELVEPPGAAAQHTWPSVQVLPQPPQFCVLSAVHCQLLPLPQHNIGPPVDGQPWPHDWQWAASRATQPLPQHSCGSPQLVPQLPQLLRSLRVSVQPLPQQVLLS